MSTANLLNTQFDDSEDEEDNFNPQPADLSDVEDDNDADAGAQIRNEASARRVSEGGSDDESTQDLAPAKKRSPQQDDNEADEDAEGEGEDTAPNALDDEDDEEEEEDDDEEEITVRL